MNLKSFCNDIFQRWSCNIFAFASLFGICSYYIFYYLILPMDNSDDKLPAFLYYSIFYFYYQIFCVVVFLMFLFLERNSDFRIKNPLLRKFLSNIFYRILAVIFILIEIAMLGLVLYLYILFAGYL